MSFDVSAVFWTRDPGIKLDKDNLYKIRIPKESTVSDLSNIINHLLQNADYSEYGFIINNQLLQHSLKELPITVDQEDIELFIEYFVRANETGNEVLNSEDDWIRCIMYKQNILATGSFDSGIRIYTDHHDSSKVTLLEGHCQCVVSLESINDSEFLSSSNDSTIRWWNVDGTCIGIFLGNGHPITNIKYINSSSQIIAGTFDGHILSWSMTDLIKATIDNKEKGKRRGKEDSPPKYCPNKIIKAHENCINGFYICRQHYQHKDGNDSNGDNGKGELQVYSCSLDGKLKAWSLNDWKELSSRSFPEAITCMDINDNGKILLGHPSGSVRCINSIKLNINNDQNDKDNSNDKIQIMKNVHSGWISCIRWKNDQEFISTGYDGKAMIWNINYPNRPKHILLELTKYKIFACEMATDSQDALYFGGEDRKLYRFNNISSIG